MRKRYGKYIFEVKFSMDDELYFKVIKFLKKRKLKKSKFCKRALINQIKKTIEIENRLRDKQHAI